MTENQEAPELEDLISRTYAMETLGLDRNWFVRREGTKLTVYKEEGKRNATVFYDRREIQAILSPVIPLEEKKTA